MSQTKVKSGLISDQSITASKLDVTGNGNSGELLASAGDGSFVWTGDLATKVDGTGTANYISKWSDSNTLTNSVIYDNGTNVGIGTSSPATELEVSNNNFTTNAAGSIITITNESQGVTAADVSLGAINFVSNDPSSGGTGVGGSLGVYSERPFDGGPANTYMSFHSRNGSTSAERMRIDSSGNVGIGNSVASAFNQRVSAPHLVVGSGSNSAGVTIYSGTSSQGSINFADGTTTTEQYMGGIVYVHGSDNYMVFNTNGSSERMRITSSGNIGIGTPTPNTKLEILDNNASTTTTVGLTITNGSSTTGSNAGILFKNFDNIQSWIRSPRTGNYSGTLSFGTATNAVGLDESYVVERMRLENDGDLHVDGDVIAYSTTVSDERLKDNITTIDNALDKVCELRGVEYDWNASSRAGQHDMGVIAQEVEKVFPFIVREKEMPLVDGNTYKTVDYEKLVGVLIEAVKELKQEIEILKSK